MPTQEGQNLQSYLAGEVALWLQRYCGAELEFLGCHDISSVSVPKGDVNPVYCRTGKRTYEITRTWRGVAGLGSMTISAYAQVLNLIAELPCPPNIIAMVSACGSDEDPTNYDFAYWFYNVELTSEDVDTLSIMVPDGETPVTLSMPASFTERDKVKKVSAEILDVSSLTTMDINDIAFCDDPECSDLCGTYSQGCQIGYAVTSGQGGTAVYLTTTEGGGTWSSNATPFTTVTDDIVAIDCDGDVVVMVNGLTAEYAYSQDGGTSFSTVSVTKVMTDVFVLGATRIWFCGNDGYIWYSSDRGASVSIQDAGGATSQTLASIAFADSKRGYAVGASNAFVYTTDGGATWVAGTGPSAGNNLTEVIAVPNTKILFVGDNIGNVYRSVDAGTNWTTVFAATTATAGGIAGLTLDGCNVVSFVANNLDPYWYASNVDGVMYRSLDGGSSWENVDISPNDGVNAITQCMMNKYWVVGENAFLAKVTGLTI
jgi:hypothetical protein